MNILNLFRQKPEPSIFAGRVNAGKKRVITLLRVAALAAAVLLTSSAASTPALALAGTASDAAIQTAHNVLDNRDNANTILSYVHYGADYKGHKFLQSRGVVDENGNTINGEFTLMYRYYWEDDGVTDIEFLCHPNGSIYQANIISTTAKLSQPFLAANVMIQLLGNVLIESNKDSMSPSDIRIARELVKNADAHGLLNLWLRLQ
jgi:hypothetical protein